MLYEVITKIEGLERGADAYLYKPFEPKELEVRLRKLIEGLVAEKRFPSGTVRRILGVSTVYVSDSPIEVRIRMRDATEVDRFCSDCHPMLREVTRRDQIARDVHPSGIVPKKANKSSGILDNKGRVTCET